GGDPRQVRELEEPDQLVRARQGEGQEPLDVFAIEIRAAQDNGGQPLPSLLEPAGQGRVRVELDRAEAPPPDGDGPRPRSQPKAEGVAEGMGRVGGDGENALAGFGERHRDGRRTRRLADAAFAAEEAEEGRRSAPAPLSDGGGSWRSRLRLGPRFPRALRPRRWPRPLRSSSRPGAGRGRGCARGSRGCGPGGPSPSPRTPLR